MSRKKCASTVRSKHGKKAKVYTSRKNMKNPQVLVECGQVTTSNGSWSLGVLPGWNCGDEATRWLSVYLNETEKSTGKRSKPLATYVLVRACSRDAARRMSIYGPKSNAFNGNVDLQKAGKDLRMRDVPVSANDRVFLQRLCSIEHCIAEFSELASR